ncbi:MAG TPA: glycosyltransferase N-terminal domain-containing protein [Holophagaceae bacterium]|nr:glycosyltransferase N-terminal domain-containing protein [Holophagaceae bacterium]
MNLAEFSYASLVTLAGATARALRRGLPAGWRLRLEAEAPEGLPEGRWIWLHAVSVGELLLAEGLLSRLRDAGHRVHVTTGTPAGMDLLRERLPRWDAGSARVSGGAFPVDDGTGLRTFLRDRPGLFIALETELWPNLLRRLREAGVPCAVVNGRLTGKSLSKGGAWMRAAARRLDLVAARDAASVAAFRALGAPQVALGGNLKADLPPPPELHAGWAHLRSAWSGDPVLVIGNTIAGEEAPLLDLWAGLRSTHPQLRLILAPRQPRRFDEVAALMAARIPTLRRASEPWPDGPEGWRETEALLLDTLGELPRVYGEGDLALVGGGWAGEGGHNPLEPLRLGVPTLIGPGYSNFEDLVAPLRTAGALGVVGLEALPDRCRTQLSGRPGRQERHPPQVLEGLMGALDRTWSLLQHLLPQVQAGR